MDNDGSAYNLDGECMGYTAFSQWYYRTHKGEGNLIGRFTPQVDAGGRTGQDVVVTRAFAAVNLVWTSYFPMLLTQVVLDERGIYAVIRNVLANTRRPVILHITRNPYEAAILNDSLKHR
jgi:hypothetical protein